MIEQAKKTEDSITKASFSESPAYKYMSGLRKPVSARVDSGLYSAFKSVAKRLYGSVCHALEVYMIALIQTTENPASICNTDGRPINIEKIVIERNLRERRRLEIDGELDAEKNFKCTFRYCKETAVKRGIWLPRQELHNLCQSHLTTAENNPEKWRLLDDE